MGQTKVQYNGQPTVLPWSEAKASQVKQFLGIPDQRNLVVREGGQSRFLRPDETVQLHEDMNLADAPRFRWGASDAAKERAAREWARKKQEEFRRREAEFMRKLREQQHRQAQQRSGRR